MNAWPTPPPPPPPPPPLLPQQQEQQQPQPQRQQQEPPPPPPPLPPPPPSPPPPRQQHQQYTSGRVSSMTSRLGQKAVSVAAGVSLVALLVLLWTVVVVKRLPAPYPSPPDARTPATAITTAPAFKETRLPGGYKPTDNGEEIFSDTTAVPTETPTAIHVPERSHPHTLRKEGSGNMPCDAKREDVRVEYITPLKISTLSYHKDDLRYSDDWSSTPEWPKTSDFDPMNAASTSIDSGHFRHRQAQLWDPHPQYTFCAFGHFFHLILAEDSSFVSPRLRVTHLWHNYTQRESPPVRTEKCFYTGSVSGDPKSSVAVNLCHGMRGHIHTSSGNYLIQPVEPWLQHNKSMIHKVSMVNPRSTYSNTSSSLHCGLEGNDTRKIKNDGLQDLRRAKRGLRMSSPSRRKLMSQREYFVEVMVVADKKMAEYHGDDLKDYILTLMSIVAKLYKDSSIGNPISVAVVKLMVLRDQEFISRPHKYSSRGKHMIGTSASKMRLHFCGWQRQYHIYHDDHHDTALLLTRENICRDPSEHKCETVGLAERGSMCDMNASCAIVQDNGFSAAFSIAHEFGHMLNMPHDDAEECKAFTDSDGSLNVMSRMLGTSPWSWSKCSRHFVTEFLEAGHGGCLLDSPSEEISIPGKELPGENFPADRQCQLQFGQGYRLCSYMPVCQQLWCSLGGEEEGGCITKHVPWADGTSCGSGKWCQRGSCVVRDPQALIPLDGGWGSWDKFGECSRTCGGGVKRATRECNNPPPANGGRYCVGRRLKFQSCNTKNCPKNSKDFREVQCAAFNNNTFGLKEFPPDVKWVPKYGINPEHRCQLNCRVANTPTHFPLRDKVVDGTPCGPDTFDICVNGQCRPAGCDHYLGSKAKLDICGTCNGDNSSCHLVTGTFNKTVSSTGYNEVVRIPIGSINVDIQQLGYQGDSNDGNYLALKDDSNEYIINGNYVLNTYHKIISLNGTKIEYTGINSSIERINATKPLKQDLIIQILSVGKLYPPQITYKYVIRCLWKYSQWSECTKQCLGVSYRMPYCSLLDRNEEIAEHYCSKMPKPKVMEKQCNSQCNISWQLTATECSVQCGRGYRNLTAHCIVEIAPNEVQHIDSHLCIQHLETPPEYEECEVPCGHWKFGDWGSCSKTCGGGYQHRLVECVGNLGEPVNESLCNAHQRVTMQKCASSSCPSWKLGDWTPCSVTCGTGERRRPYWCNQDNRIVSPQFCNSQLPPPHRERCSRACSASWQQELIDVWLPMDIFEDMSGPQFAYQHFCECVILH